MKKLLLFTAAILVIASVNAQSDASSVKKEKKQEKKELRKLEGTDASYQSKDAFYKDFGDMENVSWKKTPTFDEAEFTKNGITMKAFYDIDANLVGTETKKEFADLPVNAATYINKKYGDYTKDKVIFFDDNEFNETNMVLYGNEFDDADNFFVELSKADKTIVLRVNMEGEVSYFTQLR
ncbi:MAG: hypothetical protein QM802_20945 [Agriterribacter sp.]